MKFMIYTEDRVDGLETRLANRSAHLEHLKAGESVKILGAGPWLGADETPKGSLLVVEANCINCVNAWLENDPYVKAGLTAKTLIHPLGGWSDFAPASDARSAKAGFFARLKS